MVTNPVCRRCGGPAGVVDLVVGNATTDPLLVRECPRCGSIVDIGVHHW